MLVTVRSDGTDDRPDADADAADEVRTIVAAAVPDGVEYHRTGTADILGHLKEESLDDAERGELIALPILIVVLLMVFRTPVGALIPAVFGGLSVLAGMGLLFVATEFTDLTVFAATLASMMGVALGVDYSLLLISRYREETARGATPQQAALAASQSAGRTVVHAGAALAVAMVAAMLLTDGDLLNPPAIGVLAATVVSVLGALVALPALLVLVGPRVERRVPATTERPGLGAKLARKALQRPGPAFVAALVPLLALAAPTLELETGPGSIGQLPPGSEARDDFAAVVDAVGPGWAAPFALVAADGTTLDGLRDDLAADPDVAQVLGPQPGSDGAARLLVVPAVDPFRGDLDGLRDRLGAYEGVLVGGVAAEQAEFDEDTGAQLPKLVVGLAIVTFLLLVLMLRAPVLALLATALNLLTVAAAFGVLTLLYQGDDPLLGDAGYLEIVTTVSMFTVILGLSLDYQVFLLSRMREGYRRTGDPAAAVDWGLDRTARVVTGAAAIMVGVFVAFSTAQVATVQQFGIGLTVAIAIDATLVRMVLLPAAMRLGGRSAWWTPGRTRRDRSGPEVADMAVSAP